MNSLTTAAPPLMSTGSRIVTCLLTTTCLLLAVTLMAACSGTMTPAQQARVDACLKQCQASTIRGPDTPSSGDWNRTHGSYDTRSSCERACY